MKRLQMSQFRAVVSPVRIRGSSACLCRRPSAHGRVQSQDVFEMSRDPGTHLQVGGCQPCPTRSGTGDNQKLAIQHGDRASLKAPVFLRISLGYFHDQPHRRRSNRPRAQRGYLQGDRRQAPPLPDGRSRGSAAGVALVDGAAGQDRGRRQGSNVGLRRNILKIRKAAPDCRPGSFCGSRHPAPTPEAD
jgi:hypothetical protein